MRFSGWLMLGLLLASAVVGSACGFATDDRDATSGCPRDRLPRPPVEAPTRPVGVVSVPRDVVAAHVCVYASRLQSGESRYVPTQLLKLSPPLARTLAGLLRQSIAPRRGSGCMVDPIVVQLRSASTGTANYVLAGCSPAFVDDGRSSAWLSGTSASALQNLGGGLIDDTNPAHSIIADFTGQSLRSALDSARRRHIELGAAGELVRTRMPMGTVLWQSPLPGAIGDPQSAQVSVLVAVPRAPTCQAQQLTGRYKENSPTSGDTRNGSLTLFNISATPCSLRGTIRVQGRDAEGRRVTDTSSIRVHTPLVLSPRTRPSAPHAALYATLGAFHGASMSQPCTDVTQPVTWSIALRQRGRISIRNVDTTDGRNRARSFYTCRGALSADAGGARLHQG